jgi:bile acid-coenzyme A ligase
VNFLALVPTIAVRLLKSPTIRTRDLSSIENVILGAGATPAWAIRELIALTSPETIKLGYGMSESLAASFVRGDEWLQHPGSVGKPIGVETLVADEDGNPLPPGEVGELFFRPIGGGEAFKYVGDAVPRTLPGGWASVGDLGRLDAEGYLYIADRRIDMVKTGGSNVFVSEVEAALLQHADVADVAVIGLPDPEWSRRVHAVIQLRPGADPASMDAVLRDHCKALLAAYKAPRSFEYVAELGRTDYVRVLDQHGLGDLQPKLRQMTRDGAWAKMAGEIGDEVLDLFCPTGTPGEIGAALQQRWDGLVDQISLPVDFWQRHGENREWRDAAAALKG